MFWRVGLLAGTVKVTTYGYSSSPFFFSLSVSVSEATVELYCSCLFYASSRISPPSSPWAVVFLDDISNIVFGPRFGLLCAPRRISTVCQGRGCDPNTPRRVGESFEATCDDGEGHRDTYTRTHRIHWRAHTVRIQSQNDGLLQCSEKELTSCSRIDLNRESSYCHEVGDSTLGHVICNYISDPSRIAQWLNTHSHTRAHALSTGRRGRVRTGSTKTRQAGGDGGATRRRHQAKSDLGDGDGQDQGSKGPDDNGDDIITLTTSSTTSGPEPFCSSGI